jgi:hypothetical protein
MDGTMKEESRQSPDEGEIKSLIQESIKESLTEAGLSPGNFKLEAIISSPQMRNGIIRQEFQALREAGVKAESAFAALQKKWGMESDYLKKVVYGERF